MDKYEALVRRMIFLIKEELYKGDILLDICERKNRNVINTEEFESITKHILIPFVMYNVEIKWESYLDTQIKINNYHIFWTIFELLNIESRVLYEQRGEKGKYYNENNNVAETVFLDIIINLLTQGNSIEFLNED